MEWDILNPSTTEGALIIGIISGLISGLIIGFFSGEYYVNKKTIQKGNNNISIQNSDIDIGGK